MKQKIRNGIFETNSSSVHSISIDNSGLEPSKFPLNDEGKIEVALGEFDKGFEIFETQHDKLSYLMTCCYYLAHCDVEAIYDNYVFGLIEDTIKEYCSCKGIQIIGDEGYIDHQSVPDYDMDIINVYSDDEIIDFVFNRYIRLKTSCD